jgi:cellulase/cellobiase CelA1
MQEQALQLLGFSLYITLASNGELVIADGGVEKYKAYIDSIREHIDNYPDTQIILVIGESAPLPMNTLRGRI